MARPVGRAQPLGACLQSSVISPARWLSLVEPSGGKGIGNTTVATEKEFRVIKVWAPEHRRQMKRLALAIPMLASVLAGSASASTQAPAQNDLMSALAGHGIVPTRRVQSDLCFPATDREYEAVGKNAVVMFVSTAALSSELPLKAAYLEIKGVRIPLQRVAIFGKHESSTGAAAGNNTYTEQVSFYLVPISALKLGASLKVDFGGQRTAFEVMDSASAKRSVKEAPTFVRVDDYDEPSDPDMGAVRALLAREYPNYFN